MKKLLYIFYYVMPTSFNYPYLSHLINREALEEARKKEEYMKRHLALQTEEAKRDMERLRIVKERREEAAKKRIAEGRAPGICAYHVIRV